MHVALSIMPQPLKMLLDPLHGAVTGVPGRAASFAKTRDVAAAMARTLPLVHRTGAAGRSTSWKAIVAEGKLAAGGVGSAAERELGYERAVYTFAGCGAYPKGQVALLFAPGVARRGDATFTPFDTGALAQWMQPADGGAAWEHAEHCRVLAEHVGRGADLAEFAGPYIAAHFRVPGDYLAYPQTSVPDFPAYHGLVSTTGDRRAWTLEVQIHDDLLLAPGDTLVAVLLDNREQLTTLKHPYLAIAHVVRDDDDESTDFFTLIAEHVRARIAL